VAHMIRVILHLQIRVTGDASDALAVAVCHANARRLQMLTQSQDGRPRNRA
jgi:Holliday junction resolvasome RuvABC endonuclease subunit